MFTNLANMMFFVSLLILLYFSLTNYNKTIKYYYIFTFVIPNFHYLKMPLSFNILGYFITTLAFIRIKNDFKGNILKNKYIRYLIIIFCVMTYTSLIKFFILESTLDFTLYFAYIRALTLTFYTYIYIKNSNTIYSAIDQIIFPTLIVNLLLGFIQIILPKSVNLFHTFYYKPSLTPLQKMVDLGKFNRVYGSFGTPVYLGVLALLSFSFYLQLRENKIERTKKLALSAILGFLSLSKTAIIGIVILIFTNIALNHKRILFNKNILYSILSLSLFIMMFLKLTDLLSTSTLSINYYMDVISEFDLKTMFSTRYSIESGILSQSYETSLENIIFGIGFLKIKNVFTGDSTYFNMTYRFGIIFTIIYLYIFLFRNIILSFKRRNNSFNIFIALALVYTTASIFTHEFNIIFLSISIFLLEKTK